MTRTEFTDLVTKCGNPDRGTAVAAQDALIDWWRDEGERNAEDARELDDLKDSIVEMICSVCLHDIRHDPICRTCAQAQVDRHVATYPRLAARA